MSVQMFLPICFSHHYFPQEKLQLPLPGHLWKWMRNYLSLSTEIIHVSTYCWRSVFLFCLCNSSLPASPSDSAYVNKITKLQRKGKDMYSTNHPMLSGKREATPTECGSSEKANQEHVLWPVECLASVQFVLFCPRRLSYFFFLRDVNDLRSSVLFNLWEVKIYF